MSLLSEMLADSPGGCWMLATTTDESGNGNTLTEISAPPTVASIIPSVSTLARDFNGAGQSMSAVDHASLDVGDVFTTEAWIQADAWPAAGFVDDVIKKGSDSFQFYVNEFGRLGLAKGNVAIIVTSTITMSLGVAYHCVATKNGATTVLYINGVDRTGTVTDSTCISNAATMYIGTDVGTANEAFDGRIQAAAVYPTALSADRVQAHYLAGTALSLISDTPMPIMGRGATW